VRTCHQALARGDGLFAANGRKLPEKLIEGIAALQPAPGIVHGAGSASAPAVKLTRLHATAATNHQTSGAGGFETD
jgi:hypothetical protein